MPDALRDDLEGVGLTLVQLRKGYDKEKVKRIIAFVNDDRGARFKEVGKICKEATDLDEQTRFALGAIVN